MTEKENDPMWREMMSNVEKSEELSQHQHEEYIHVQIKKKRSMHKFILVSHKKKKKLAMKEENSNFKGCSTRYKGYKKAFE